MGKTEHVSMKLEDNKEVSKHVEIKNKLLHKLDVEKQIYKKKDLQLRRDYVEILTCEILAREKLLMEKRGTLNAEKIQNEKSISKLSQQKINMEALLFERNSIHEATNKKLIEEIENLSTSLEKVKKGFEERKILMTKMEGFVEKSLSEEDFETLDDIFNGFEL